MAKKSNGSGGYSGYFVEVRLRADMGQVVALYPSFILSREWQRVPVGEGDIGFNCELWRWSPHARDLRILDYAVAIGIAAQLHAAMRQLNFVMEFRLRRAKVEYSYTCEPTGDGEPFSFDAMAKAEKFSEPVADSPGEGK